MDQQANPTSNRKQHRFDLYFPNIDNYFPQDIEVDNLIDCSFISRAYLIEIGWLSKLRFVDDGHYCEHQNAPRIVLKLGYDPSVSRGGTFDVTFCLLETPETVAVMSANEEFWATCPKKRPIAMAPIRLNRITRGAYTSFDRISLFSAKLTREPEREEAQRLRNLQCAEREHKKLQTRNERDREPPPKPKPGAQGKEPNNQGAEGSPGGAK